MKAEIVARLWQQFHPLVVQRVELLQAHVAGDPAAPREEALRVAHDLAGSLGSYGRPEGSELARAIEAALRDGAPAATVAGQVTRLRAVVDG
jgi:HPt (histidine-containing phosphotransfer) domain-containing protein